MFATGSMSDKSSGPYWSLRETATTLSRRGHHVTVIGTRKKDVPAVSEWPGVTVKSFPSIGPTSWHVAPVIRPYLRAVGQLPAVVSLQGLWLGLNLDIADWAESHHIPYMVTIHGNLNPAALRISAAKKKLAQWIFFSRLLRRATCLQALNEEEYLCIRRFGLTQPICIVPNGAALPDQKVVPESGAVRPSGSSKRIALYLGRLHPIKNLSSLLRAWSSVANRHPDWLLVVAGDGPRSYKDQLMSIASEAPRESIFFVGHVQGEEKSAWLREAQLFVLPSSSEGFAMAPLEALAYGTPVLLTTACNFPEVESVGCGVLSDSSPAGIATALDRLLALAPVDLRLMGGRGRQLVKTRYSWDVICNQLEGVYRWMAGDGRAPDVLRTD